MLAGNKNPEFHRISITKTNLEADMSIPIDAKGIILFAHGSGSNRHSTRNQYVAQILNDAGFATLLVDLLTQEEKETDERTRHIRYDIDLLASRFELVTDWILQQPNTRDLAMGYFGSSTGAAAALIAAARSGNIVRAVVARGGRPDLVEDQLQSLTASTLFIAGGTDNVVLGINKRALKVLDKAKAKDLVVIPGAGHLFEEPGKMEEVARAAVDWFESYLLETGKKFQSRYSRNGISTLISMSEKRPTLGLKFRNRSAAGEMLSTLLRKYKGDNPIVIGVPRGGVIVADVIARNLSSDFDIVVPRRLRDPFDSENAIGAVMQDGSLYLDKYLIQQNNLPGEYLEAEKLEQKKEIERRLALYRSSSEEYKIRGKTAILVDDGAATGATLTVAARWIRTHQPNRLVMAIPVLSPRAMYLLVEEADNLEFIRNPSNFQAVELFYRDFGPISDEQIMHIMKDRKQ